MESSPSVRSWFGILKLGIVLFVCVVLYRTFASVKQAQQRLDSDTVSYPWRFGTTDSNLVAAIQANDAPAVREALAHARAEDIHKNILSGLSSRPEVLKVFLEAKFDPDGGEHAGAPLLAALAGFHQRSVELLLAYGANPRLLYDSAPGRGAITRFISQAETPFALRLLDIWKELDRDEVYVECLLAGRIDLVQELKKRGVKEEQLIRRPDLLVSASVESVDGTRYLLDHQADPNTLGFSRSPTAPLQMLNAARARNASWKPYKAVRLTPLAAAVKVNNLETVGLLLQHGANPDQECEDGSTAWSLAKSEEARALLRAGRLERAR